MERTVKELNEELSKYLENMSDKDSFEPINEDTEVNPDVAQRRQNLRKAAEELGLTVQGFVSLKTQGVMLYFKGFKFIEFTVFINVDKPTDFYLTFPANTEIQRAKNQDEYIHITDEIAKTQIIAKAL